MLKSTIVKWAVAALFAVPAGSAFAKPVHKALTSRTHSRKTLTAASKGAHRYHHTVRRHVTLTAKRSVTAHRLSAAVHRTVHTSTKLSAKPAMKVHVTKMPPTIDGMNT